MMLGLTDDVKVSLKVMVNKEKTKVLFAEADTKFVEIILSFLTLPLGEILRVLKKHYSDKEPVVGSLNTLHTSLENLDDSNFWTHGGKKMLLNPRNPFINERIKHFRCGDKDCKYNVSMYYDSGICDCGKALNRAMGAIDPRSGTYNNGNAIFAEGLPFLVTDDLKITPHETGSLIQSLINLDIVVTEGADNLNATLGYTEIVDLLKGALFSKTPLTDTILRVSNENMNCVLEDFLGIIEPSPDVAPYKRMTVTALIQKSSNKLLYIIAKNDFVDFLFSFLTIPLGRVNYLLGSNTCFKSIDNLYNSTRDLIKDKHWMNKNAKRRVQEPELSPYYISKNQIFPLSEQVNHPIYFYESIRDSERTVEKGFWMCYKDPKGDHGCYVKQPGTFFISDNLTVQQSNLLSKDFIRYELKVPPSDVTEMEVQIGLKEAANILKASLASTSALSDGLIDPLLQMQSR